LSTLYIRLPSNAAADGPARWTALFCPFALVLHGSSIEREGVAPLSDLSDLAVKAQRVVLLLAASDVSLLRVQAPPMSAARLKAALPNLVEDRLITDPAECVVVAGALSDGLRTVAVVQRTWLETITKTFITLGVRHIAALPAQLCLPYQTDTVSAAITEHDADIDVTLRLSEQDGIGLPIMPEQHESAAREVIEALRAVVPQAPITLYVPQSAVRTYQEAASGEGARDERISVFADNWAHWIAGAGSTSLDLMAGLSAAASGSQLNWRPWRWPLALAGIVLVINVVALNIDWWHLKSEADSLRVTMTQIYKSAFPKDPVIVDPLAQMRQKIAAAKRDSGQAAPDDFTALAAAFGEAWARVTQAQPAGKSAAPGIAALEYRDRSLFVRLKPDGKAPTEQMKTALAGRALSLDLAPSQSAAVVWQIRSAK
jgi:general secretion pathway protein L